MLFEIRRIAELGGGLLEVTASAGRAVPEALREASRGLRSSDMRVAAGKITAVGADHIVVKVVDVHECAKVREGLYTSINWSPDGMAVLADRLVKVAPKGKRAEDEMRSIEGWIGQLAKVTVAGEKAGNANSSRAHLEASQHHKAKARALEAEGRHEAASYHNHAATLHQEAANARGDQARARRASAAAAGFEEGENEADRMERLATTPAPDLSKLSPSQLMGGLQLRPGASLVGAVGQAVLSRQLTIAKRFERSKSVDALRKAQEALAKLEKSTNMPRDHYQAARTVGHPAVNGGWGEVRPAKYQDGSFNAAAGGIDPAVLRAIAGARRFDPMKPTKGNREAPTDHLDSKGMP
jgi:hypothetical protein